MSLFGRPPSATPTSVFGGDSHSGGVNSASANKARSFFQSASQSSQPQAGISAQDGKPPTRSLFTNNKPEVAGSTLFGKTPTVNTHPGSVFNSRAALQAQNSTSKPLLNINAAAPQDPARSLFRQANSTVNKSTFGGSTSMNMNLTRQNSTSGERFIPSQPTNEQRSGSLFTKKMPFGNSSITNTEMHQPPEQSQKPRALFGKPAGLFGKPVDVADDTKLYSDLANLTVEEIKAFEDDDFVFGCIPIKLPPREMCFG